MTTLGKVVLAIVLFSIFIGSLSLLTENAKLRQYRPIEVYTIEYTFPVSLQDADIPEVFREYNLTVEFTMFDDNHVDTEIVDMVFIKHVVDIGDLEVFTSSVAQ